MGAWGEGMQANDTALDAVSVVSRKLRHSFRNAKEVAAALKFKEGSHEARDQALLGAAEWLLEHSANLSHAKQAIEAAIGREMSKKRIECWTNPDGRKDALLRFRAALRGEEKDPAARKDDNMGLFERLATGPKHSKVEAMIARKSVLVLDLDAESKKESPDKAKIKALALDAAKLEFQVAEYLLASGQEEDAAVNVVSLVSLLVSATQKPSAHKLLVSVLRHTFAK